MIERETSGTSRETVQSLPQKLRLVLHRHTYRGRYDEYMDRYGYFFGDVRNGLEGYELRTRMEANARKYAKERVVRDVLLAATTASAAGALVTEGVRGRLGRDAAAIAGAVRSWPESVGNAAGKVNGRIMNTIAEWSRTAGESAAAGALHTVSRDGPETAAAILKTVAEQGPDIADPLMESLGTGGSRAIAHAIGQNRDALSDAAREAAGAAVDGAARSLKTNAKIAALEVGIRVLDGIGRILGRGDADRSG